MNFQIKTGCAFGTGGERHIYVVESLLTGKEYGTYTKQTDAAGKMNALQEGFSEGVAFEANRTVLTTRVVLILLAAAFTIGWAVSPYLNSLEHNVKHVVHQITKENK